MGSAIAGAVPHVRNSAEVECFGHQDSRVIRAMSTPDQKKQNVRLGLILASIAVVFFVGFIAKAALFGL
jgi:hypothetical protein